MIRTRSSTESAATSLAVTEKRCFRSLVPSMTMTRSSGICVFQADRQCLQPVLVQALDRIVVHGGAAAMAFLDDLPAAAPTACA